ncbi:MAG: dihydrofolate reductase [Clostridia bacterium]|nr:dihydrofolate reductase [Clostridia bacterium]
MISAIVAVDNNWGIGYKGDLLEHIPEDLKYFKEITNNNWIVMGRKTWDSLPKKPLPNRPHLVITNDPFSYEDIDEVLFTKIGQAKLIMNQQKGIDFFVIGGGQIYEKLLPMCDRVYVTKIFKDHDQVDTYFPNLDESDEWAPAACTNIRQYKDLTYQFWQYDRI